MIALDRNETLSLVFEKIVRIREEVEDCEGGSRKTPESLAANLKRIDDLARRACAIIEAHEKQGAVVVPENDARDALTFLHGRGRTLIERTLFAAEGVREVLDRIGSKA